MDVLPFFGALLPVAEQVIDVPKIIVEDIPSRTSVREPLLAEQLVEVPKIFYFLKQTVDIPVPRGRGRRLQGSRPGQGSRASSSSTVSRSPTVARNVDEPFQGFFFCTFPLPGSPVRSWVRAVPSVSMPMITSGSL